MGRKYFLDPSTGEKVYIRDKVPSLSDYRKKSDQDTIDNGIKSLVNTKQDKLTAGDNIEISDDGTISASGNVTDVQINGTSILDNGVANIPKASQTKLGLVKAITYDEKSAGVYSNGDYWLTLHGTKNSEIDNRIAEAGNSCINKEPIYASKLDYAVKAAMCDGRGAAWTEEQKAAARTRIGADNWEVIAFGKTTETSLGISIDTDINGNSFGLRKYRFFVMNAPKITDETYGTYSFLEENNVTAAPYNRPAPYTNVVKPPETDYYNGCLVEMECVGEDTRMYKVTRGGLTFHGDSLLYGGDLKKFYTGLKDAQTVSYLQTGYTNQSNGITQVGMYGTGTAYFPRGTVYYLLGVRK